MRLALNVPYADKIHSANSIRHLMGQAIGVYLGIGASQKTGEIMGPDQHSETEAQKPAPEEIQTARQIQDARTKLLSYAQRRVAIEGRAGLSGFASRPPIEPSPFDSV